MTKEHLPTIRDIGILIAVLVGLVSLGIMPRCDELQTVSAAQREHAAITEDCKEEMRDLKSMVQRIHEHLMGR